MTKSIAVLATFDTKGAECAYLADEIRRMGATPVLIDISVIRDPEMRVDVSADEVARAGGTSLEALRQNPSRETASEAMVKGASRVVSNLLVQSDAIHGIVSLGGTQGTGNCTRVMQALPYGFPKVMVSTMAAGDVTRYVGIKDITMMFSVSDILGLSPLLRSILSGAAGAIVGMADASRPIEFSPDRPVIGITNLGALTRGTMHAIERLNERGYETMVFHAVGSGGRAMEQLMRDGIIHGVLDFALGDILDAQCGGIRAADEDRLTVAGSLGLPQVVVPGGTDHLGILLTEPNAVPQAYRERKSTFHNPYILVPRTNAQELSELSATMARRLQNAKGPITVMVPTKGLSSYSVAGAPLEDTAADAQFFAALRRDLSVPIIEIDAAAEDAGFIDAATDELVRLISQARSA